VLPGHPPLKIDNKQFGKKIGTHAQDFGFPPGDAAGRAFIKKRIGEVRANPTEVRQGPYHPGNGGGDDYLFFRQGSDMVITKPDGTFVTIYPIKGKATHWFENANVIHVDTLPPLAGVTGGTAANLAGAGRHENR
jgi:hypothetical protein